MAEKFAGAVVLGDLSDFIEPSQACVNPLFAADVNAAKQEADAQKKGAAKISLDSGIFSGIGCDPPGAGRRLDTDAHPTIAAAQRVGRPARPHQGHREQDGQGVAERLPGMQVRRRPRPPIAAVTRVTARCSGCVTTAEAVLITQQSVSEFLSRLKDPVRAAAASSLAREAARSQTRPRPAAIQTTSRHGVAGCKGVARGALGPECASSAAQAHRAVQGPSVVAPRRARFPRLSPPPANAFRTASRRRSRL